MVFAACKRGPGRPTQQRFGPKKFNNTNKAPAMKRKATENGDDEVAPTAKKGRGRGCSQSEEEVPAPAKKRRGRPREVKINPRSLPQASPM